MQLELSIRERLENLDTAFVSLSFYKGLQDTDTGKAFGQLISLLLEPNTAQSLLLKAYHQLLYDLFEELEDSVISGPGDAWQNFVLEFILTNDNPFSRFAERFPLKDISTSMLITAKHDLNVLEELFSATEVVMSVLPNFNAGLPILTEYPNWAQASANSISGGPGKLNAQLKKRFYTSSHWDLLIDELAAFHHRKGCGPLATYIAFKWDSLQKTMVGIPNPDPISLGDLAEYEYERETVVANTRQFLQGAPANNILLYGDRGTGKSSTVKSLLNAFWEEGLRMVEIAKNQLSDLPFLMKILSKKPQRFIIFIDDLSFEEKETEYLNLKVVLEGGLEARPSNVLIYATSNRRHLIKEMSSDRDTQRIKIGDEEFRVQDSLQEKLSLADRFGITVIFPAPGQASYLRIVEKIAHDRHIDLDPEILRRRALQWSLMHNGPSGRTARQFVDHLEGSLK